MKKLTVVLLCVFLSALFRVEGTAAEIEEYYASQYEASGASELSDYLDDNAREYLESIGFDAGDIEGITSFSLSSVFEMIFDMLRNNLSKPLKGCMTATGAVLMVSVCSAFFPNDEKAKGVLNLICGSFVLVSVFLPAVDVIKSGATAMKLCAGFEKALIPVLAAILTASGNPASALSYQGAAFTAAQAIEALANGFVIPLVTVSGMLGAVGALLPTLKLSAVSDMVRKTSSTVIGMAAAIFSGFFSLKSIISGSADSLTAKGIRLATSTFIPVVGGALSEAYSALSGSLSLLRGAVGIYGIMAVVSLCLPIILNLALWSLAMRVACTVSDLTGNSQCSDILKNISYMFSMLNTMLIFSVAVFVISSGLVAAMKTGG
ncbi:MAG: hypothetical protein J6R20_06950 [Clostridia bacterium]|nr:hypothetical protein [Clostridia bacterium]